MDPKSDYRGDVIYEVYRCGGNVDRIDLDRVDRCFESGLSEEIAARRELQHQEPPRAIDPELEFQ
jgi:hypothetical protein